MESAVYRYYIGLRKGQIVKDGYEALKEVVGNKALRQWLVDNIKSHIVAGQLCEFFERVKIPGEVSIDDVNEYPKLLVCLSHESSLSNLNHHLFQPDLASTKQNGEKAKSKGRGRPQKYDEKFLRRVYATFEQKYRVTGHKKQAWHETAAEHKLKSGKAAEIACRRYLKNQNKKQN